MASGTDRERGRAVDSWGRNPRALTVPSLVACDPRKLRKPAAQEEPDVKRTDWWIAGTWTLGWSTPLMRSSSAFSRR
jgi:hypothetical protein